MHGLQKIRKNNLPAINEFNGDHFAVGKNVNVKMNGEKIDNGVVTSNTGDTITVNCGRSGIRMFDKVTGHDGTGNTSVHPGSDYDERVRGRPGDDYVELN